MGAGNSAPVSNMQQWESQLTMVGAYNDNLCCAPLHSLHPGSCCYRVCGCGGPDMRPPAGPLWEAALHGSPLRQLLDEARCIVEGAPGDCCGACPCPDNYAAQALLNSQWTPRANEQLAPFGLRARVDAWTVVSYNDKGERSETKYLMIRFLAGSPAVLRQLVEMDRAMATGGAVVLAGGPVAVSVVSGEPKLPGAYGQQPQQLYMQQQQQQQPYMQQQQPQYMAAQGPAYYGGGAPAYVPPGAAQQPQPYYAGAPSYQQQLAGGAPGYQQQQAVPMGFEHSGAAGFAKNV